MNNDVPMDLNDPASETWYKFATRKCGEFFVPAVPTRWLRARYVTTGVVLPLILICWNLLSRLSFVFDRPWQSGQVRDHVAMLLVWPAMGPLLAPTAFSMVTMSCWVFRPATSRHASVRLGIYTGVFVAGLFLAFVVIVTDHTTFICALYFAPSFLLLCLVMQYISRRLRQFGVRDLILLMTVSAAMMVGGRAIVRSHDGQKMLHIIGDSAGIAVVAALGATPTLNLITYMRVAIHVWRSENVSPMFTGIRPWAWLLS